MTTPSLLGWILLLWLLVILPRGAMRSARIFRHAQESGSDASLPRRRQLFLGTMFVLGITFLQAWMVAGEYGWGLFEVPTLGVRELGLGVTSLALLLLLRQANYWIRTPEERRTMVVRKLLPQDRSEWGLYGITAVSAGIAEEAAYRGAIMSVLIGLTGMPWVAVLVSAVAFAVAHALQGWKSAIVIFVMALAMHGLVFLTGTLVIAMVVHAVYDLLAGVLGAREAGGEGAAIGDRGSGTDSLGPVGAG